MGEFLYLDRQSSRLLTHLLTYRRFLPLQMRLSLRHIYIFTSHVRTHSTPTCTFSCRLPFSSSVSFTSTPRTSCHSCQPHNVVRRRLHPSTGRAETAHPPQVLCPIPILLPSPILMSIPNLIGSITTGIRVATLSLRRFRYTLEVAHSRTLTSWIGVLMTPKIRTIGRRPVDGSLQPK